MTKKIGTILLVLIFVIFFIAPMRTYFDNLFHRAKSKSELEEQQIIGVVSGYNSRIKEVQDLLKDAGLDPGMPDGNMGPRTRKAIKEFQEEKGLTLSGKVDAETWVELHKQTEELLAETATQYDPSLDRQESILEGDDIKLASECIKENKAKIQDEIMSYRLKSKDRIRQIQTALKKSGFYTGDIDGKLGPRTKKAIVAFQCLKGLSPDGVVGPKTWEELNKYIKE